MKLHHYALLFLVLSSFSFNKLYAQQDCDQLEAQVTQAIKALQQQRKDCENLKIKIERKEAALKKANDDLLKIEKKGDALKKGLSQANAEHRNLTNMLKTMGKIYTNRKSIPKGGSHFGIRGVKGKNIAGIGGTYVGFSGPEAASAAMDKFNKTFKPKTVGSTLAALQNLKKQIKKIQQDINANKKAAAKKRDQIRKLEGELQDLKNQLADCPSKIAAKEGAFNNANIRLAECNARIAAFKDAEKMINDARRSQRTAESQLKNTQNNINSAEKAVENHYGTESEQRDLGRQVEQAEECNRLLEESKRKLAQAEAIAKNRNSGDPRQAQNLAQQARALAERARDCSAPVLNASLEIRNAASQKYRNKCQGCENKPDVVEYVFLMTSLKSIRIIKDEEMVRLEQLASKLLTRIDMISKLNNAFGVASLIGNAGKAATEAAANARALDEFFAFGGDYAYDVITGTGPQSVVGIDHDLGGAEMNALKKLIIDNKLGAFTDQRIQIIATGKCLKIVKEYKCIRDDKRREYRCELIPNREKSSAVDHEDNYETLLFPFGKDDSAWLDYSTAKNDRQRSIVMAKRMREVLLKYSRSKNKPCR